MRRLALLAALAACALAQPQNCYSYSSCSSCIAAGCYEYVSGGCAGSCTSSPTSTCDGVTPINNAAQCPAQPSDAANAGTRSGAAGIAGLGAAAIALTAFFAYGNVERFCGQKSEPPATAPVRTWVLFAASSALWLGLTLQLASPLLPWMVCSAGSSTSFTLATGFYVQGCNIDNNGNTICQFTVTWSDYLNVLLVGAQGNDYYLDERAYMTEALALGSSSLAFAAVFLLPAAFMVSFAVYRLQRFNRTGVAPYASGFAPTSLLVAQLLGWTSFGVFCVLWWSALGLCSTVQTKYGSSLCPPNGFSYANLPGEITAGVGFFLQLAGLAAVAFEARGALRDLPGVGCNTAGCARLTIVSEGGYYSQAPQEDYARAPQMAAPAPNEASRYATPKFLVAHSPA